VEPVQDGTANSLFADRLRKRHCHDDDEIALHNRLADPLDIDAKSVTPKVIALRMSTRPAIRMEIT
jgi:hypothetical protein